MLNEAYKLDSTGEGHNIPKVRAADTYPGPIDMP
jgi:hypothetical protein